MKQAPVTTATTKDTKQDMMVDRMDQMVSKPLKSIEHGVQGDVSLNKGIVMIKGFHYDGKAPDAVFAVSSTGTEPTKTMDKSKWKILTAGKSFGFEDAPVEGQNVATSAGGDVKLPVPQGFHPKWLAVYCRKFGVNFGHASLDNVKQDAEQDMKQAPVTTATTKDTKQDMMVDRMDQMVSKPLKSIEHGVQGDVSLNKGIVMIKGFHYDGKAPDAVFAVSSTGTEPTKTMDKSKWKIL